MDSQDYGAPHGIITEKGQAAHSSILAWRIPWGVHGVAKSRTRLSDFHFTSRGMAMRRKQEVGFILFRRAVSWAGRKERKKQISELWLGGKGGETVESPERTGGRMSASR